MTQQSTPASPAPVADEAAQLTALVTQVSALPAPSVAGDLITDAINFLFENGAADKKVVLDDIYTSASALVTAVQQTTQAFTATMSIAQTLRKQREEARQALETLKHAVETADTSVPEINELWDSIADLINEENMECIWDVADNYIAESISDNTPLTWSETHTLLDLLQGGEIEPDHYLWDVLRDWMRRASEFLRTGVTPPPGADA